MRPQDRRIFCEAAFQNRVWILVRRTNPASLAYIARDGYGPKRIDCKPKTADDDVDKRKIAGLVANPELYPKAFRGEKLKKATEIWQSFAREHRLDADKRTGTGYTLEKYESSPHYGCLKFDGKFIHGDYDLYDIISVDHPRSNLAAVETLQGVPHMRGANVLTIQKFVNRRIGVPMIQHGGEAQYTDHSEQSIDMFTPEGNDVTLLNELTVRAYYRDIWKRQTLMPRAPKNTRR
ncbi:MAG: hypothetical protein AAF802_24100 [Planctomycetota bacterium]